MLLPKPTQIVETYLATSATISTPATKKRRGRIRPRRQNAKTLSPDQRRLNPVNRIPRSSSLQLSVNVVDILHSFGLQPRTERRRSLLRVNRNPIFPCRAPPQHSVELHSGFPRQFQRLAELSVAHARRQINKRLGGHVRRLMEQVDRLFLRISLLPAKALHALNEFHVDRHFHFQHIDPIAIFAELPHAFGDDLRLLLRIVQPFLVGALVISDKLQEVW